MRIRLSAFSDTKRRQVQLNSLTVQNEPVHSLLRSLVAFKSINKWHICLTGQWLVKVVKNLNGDMKHIDTYIPGRLYRKF